MHTVCKWEITFEIIQWSAVNCSYLTWRDINSAIWTGPAWMSLLGTDANYISHVGLVNPIVN